MQNKTSVVVPPVPEHDVVIRFPDGRKWQLQYRNYDGNHKTGEGASVDIILDNTYPVYNWKGTEMKPARKATAEGQHVRCADQLCIIL